MKICRRRRGDREEYFRAKERGETACGRRAGAVKKVHSRRVGGEKDRIGPETEVEKVSSGTGGDRRMMRKEKFTEMSHHFLRTRRHKKEGNTGLAEKKGPPFKA